MMLKLVGQIKTLRSLPKLSVDLRYSETAENEDFFRRYALGFYKQTQRRHPKFPVVKAMTYGAAIKVLEGDFETYYMSLDGAARRNHKKALRKGYVARRIDFNTHLDDVRAILASAAVRQGREMPERLRKGEISENTNPASNNDIHDYPFYGTLLDDRLVAYTGCFVCGEICMIETIYGHADFQSDGVVPMAIIEGARHVMENYPGVKYYMYGTTYGASDSLRRFKKKFRFMPTKVKWVLG